MTTLKQYEINRYSRILGYGAAAAVVVVTDEAGVDPNVCSEDCSRWRTVG